GKAGARRGHADRRYVQREPGLGARGDRRARLLPGAARARARRHGRSRRPRCGLSPRGRRLRSRQGHRQPARAGRGDPRRGAGVRRRRPPLRQSGGAGCRGARQQHPRQGVALHEDGARGGGAHRRARRGRSLMLLELAQWLAKDVRLFNVFNYITLRAVLACLTALAVSLILGPYFIRKLTAYKIGQAVRDDGPRTHLTKAGTPTMGGALILVSIGITTLLWGDLSNRLLWVVLLVTVAFGAVGWVDDYRKVVHRNPKGLSPKAKLFWQSVIGLSAAVYLGFLSQNMPALNQFIVPFFKHVAYPLGTIGFVALTFFVIVGTSNAVNLTDGLDGLAIMPTVLVGSALGIFAYVAGHALFSKYLGLPYIPGAGELAVICGALSGAGLGFLWFNAYPAEVFMGDVGALALGGALGTIAVIVRQEIVLFIMGGVFVAETLSVMIQVLYFKYSGGKRIFRMAPLHHHYELEGWKESQVVVRFWIITMMLVLFGLSTLKLR